MRKGCVSQPCGLQGEPALGRPGGGSASTLGAVQPFIYLASQSPRRGQLLDQLGVRHQLLLPGPGEDVESLEDGLPGEAPARYVVRVTHLKLDAAMLRMKSRRLPTAPVLCADTTVAFGRRLYGKPADAGEARRMLGELSGKTHRVLTAIACQRGRRRLDALSISQVTFAPLTAAQIDRYVGGGEPMGKAGAYAVQGAAAAFIARIGGSHSGIMGLPLFETAQLLRAFGFANLK